MKQMVFNVLFILVITFLYVYVTVRIFDWGKDEGYKQAVKTMQNSPMVFVEKK